MEIEGPNWGLINAKEISEIKIVKAIKKNLWWLGLCKLCGRRGCGWGGEKNGVWWLGLYELCRRLGCGWGGEQKVDVMVGFV
jgi:hypothetical protein